MVFPKIGRTGEYYDDEDDTDFNQHKNPNQSIYHNNHANEESVTANQRYYYSNRNSQYIGDGVNMNRKQFGDTNRSVFEDRPTREGKGVYVNEDGQQYIGEWLKGEMHGFGKLFWNEKQIHYEG